MIHDPLIFTGTIHFRRRDKVKEIEPGPAPEPVDLPPGRIPRVAKLMALALRFDRLIRNGAIRDQTELAMLGHITRARVAQILSLIQLAPDLQEKILHLPLVMKGRDPIGERQVRPIALILDWRKQRRLWKEMTEKLPDDFSAADK